MVILDPPEAPRSPENKGKRLKVLLVGIFGMGFGAILCLVRDYFVGGDPDHQKNISELKLSIAENFSFSFPWGKKNL